MDIRLPSIALFRCFFRMPSSCTWMRHRMPLPTIEAFDSSPMIRRLSIVTSEDPLDDTAGFKPNSTPTKRRGSDRFILLNHNSTVHPYFSHLTPPLEHARTL